jgi:hypothetical protein
MLRAMATITFDTHKFVRKLEKAGFEPGQAEAVADAFREAQGEAEVATKRDIERLEAKLEARFERVDGELRLNRWMLGVLLAGVISLILRAYL